MAIPRTGCCSEARLRLVSGPWKPLVRADARDPGGRRPKREGLDLRDQVGRVQSHLPARRGGEAELREQGRARRTEVRGRRACAAEGAPDIPDCVVDGEVCALDEQGRPSFQAMQQGSGSLVLELFDLLELEASCCSTDRSRNAASGSRDSNRRVETVRFSESLTTVRLLGRRSSSDWRGSPRNADSPYQPGKRSRDWLKIKAREEQELVIAGYTKGEGRRARSFGALVLAVQRGRAGLGGQLRHRVQRGRDRAPARQAAAPRAEDLAVLWPCQRCRASGVTTSCGYPRSSLVQPIQRVDSATAARGAASYKGLRDDKESADVHREQPIETEIKRGSRVLRLSNLTRCSGPQGDHEGGSLTTTGVSRRPSSRTRDRPFTMKRYPDVIEGGHFFQKDAPSHMPDWIAKRLLSDVAGWKEQAHDQLSARQRRAGAAQADGQHGLHRHERVVFACRSSRPSRLHP